MKPRLARVRTSAPGKVLLLGEYAVTAGAPAVVAATDERLYVELRCEPVSDGRGRGRLLADGTAVEFPLSLARPADLPRPVRFAGAALLVAARARGLTDVTLEVSTRSELDRPGSKRGLGGSAAVTAAVVRAVSAVGVGVARDRARAAARDEVLGVEAHRLAQGSGSGADVVGATRGGVSWIERIGEGVPSNVAACAGATGVAAEALSLPGDLRILIGSTDTAAATGPRVARFRAAQRPSRPPARSIAAWMTGAESLARAFRETCAAADVAGCLRAFRACGRHLAKLDRLAGIPILTSQLRRGIAAAEAGGAVAKVSGAGGGDALVALVAGAQAGRVRERWQACGIEALACSATARGASVDGLVSPAEAPRAPQDHG